MSNGARDIDAYVDGELDPAQAGALGRHLRECAACANDVLERVQMKRSVARRGQALHRERRITEPNCRKRSPPSRRRKQDGCGRYSPYRPCLCSILSVAVVFTRVTRADRRQRVYSELADLHVSALASACTGRRCLHRSAYRETVVSGEDSLHLQSARATRIRVHPARRTRHLSRANARGTSRSTRFGSMKFRFSSFRIAERKPRVCPRARCTRNRSPWRTGRRMDCGIL